MTVITSDLTVFVSYKYVKVKKFTLDINFIF